MNKPLKLFLLFVLLMLVVLTATRYILYPFIGDLIPDWAGPVLPQPDSNETDTLPPFESIYQVHFIDVGQGDAILITTPGKNALIDGGERNAGVVDYLVSLAIDTIHLMVSTHPHSDHIGGLTRVLERFPVLEVWDPGVVHTTGLFTRYLEMIDSLDIPFTEARAGMEYELYSGTRTRLAHETGAGDQQENTPEGTGLHHETTTSLQRETATTSQQHETNPTALLKVLHPVEPSDHRLNDASVVTFLEMGGVSVLFAGDLERRGETELIERYPNIRAQVLKVGHHGSTTSSSDPFLDAVRPEVAVVFCATGNSYGFPHEETIHKLMDRRVAVYRTDLNGTIVLHANGSDHYLATSKGAAMEGSGEGRHAHPTVNLNTASPRELTRIVHIGPARAQQIIDMRPISSLDELTRIAGIDQNRLEEIKRQNLAYVDLPL
jgi:competence protein ComEC